MSWTKEEHKECFNYLNHKNCISSKAQFSKYGAGGYLEVVLWRQVKLLEKEYQELREKLKEII